MTKANLFNFVSSSILSTRQQEVSNCFDMGKHIEACYLLPYIKGYTKGEFKEKVEARLKAMEKKLSNEVYHREIRKGMVTLNKEILERIFDWR
ncbi:hypothetical protein [Mesotoga prima]|uniref:hypothetical protein n=1 Tax=Mesotoga prima TaxID=1184387 RepID=UPI002FDA7AD9